MDIAQYCSQIPRNIVHNGYFAILFTDTAQYCPQWTLLNTVHRYRAILSTMDFAQYCPQIPRNIVHNGHCSILFTDTAQYCPQWILRNTVHRYRAILSTMDFAQYCPQIPRNIVHNGYCAILFTLRVIQCFWGCTTKTSPHLIVMTFITITRSPQLLYILMTVYGHLHRLHLTKTIVTRTQCFKWMNSVKTDAHLNCRLYKNVLGTS